MAVTLKTFFKRWLDDITTNKAFMSADQRMEIVNANIYGRDREEEEVRAKQLWIKAGRATEMEGGIPDDYLPIASENRRYNPLHLITRGLGKLKQWACNASDEREHRKLGHTKGADGKWPPAKSGGWSIFRKVVASAIIGLAEAVSFIFISKPAELIDKLIDRGSSDARRKATLPPPLPSTPRAVQREPGNEITGADTARERQVAKAREVREAEIKLPIQRTNHHRTRSNLRSISEIAEIPLAPIGESAAPVPDAVARISISGNTNPPAPAAGSSSNRPVLPPLRFNHRGSTSTARIIPITGAGKTTHSGLIAPVTTNQKSGASTPEFDPVQLIGGVTSSSDSSPAAAASTKRAQQYATPASSPAPLVVRRKGPV